MKSLVRGGVALTIVGSMLVSAVPVAASSSALATLARGTAAGFDKSRLQELDSAFAGVVAKGDVPGLTYLLVRHGKVVAFNSFGLASPARGMSQDNQTIFRIFSMTKPITGVAMMMLYEEGKWNLDDPITKFLPEMANLKVIAGVDANGKPITVPAKRSPTMRELMSHTAGFGYGLLGRNPVDDLFRAHAVNGSKNLTEVTAKVADIPLKFQPGEGWDYSIAVDLQARIVEVITGENYGAYLQRRVLGPLGMKDTAFYVPAEKVGRFADLYGLDPKSGKIVPLPPTFAPNFNFTDPNRQQSGGGGLVSTASDYGRFCQMILNGGKLDGVRLLKPNTIALMGQDVIPVGIQPDNSLVGNMGTTAFSFGNGVGFGLDFMVIKDPKSARVPVGKGTLSWGGAAGTWFWIDPENDLFFIGMIQRLGGSAGMTDLPGLSQRLVYQAMTQPKR